MTNQTILAWTTNTAFVIAWKTADHFPLLLTKELETNAGELKILMKGFAKTIVWNFPAVPNNKYINIA